MEKYLCKCIFVLRLLNYFYLQTENRQHVEQSFRSSVMRSKLLAPHQMGQLVLFMMDHCEKVFSCPEEVEEDVQWRMDLIMQGEQVAAARMYSSCKLHRLFAFTAVD